MTPASSIFYLVTWSIDRDTFPIFLTIKINGLKILEHYPSKAIILLQKSSRNIRIGLSYIVLYITIKDFEHL